MLLYIGIALVIFGLLLKYLLTRPPDFPPGPWRLPIVGSLPFISLPLQEGLFKLSHKYGPIFSIYLFNYPVVVLCDTVLIREAFKQDKFSGRPLLKPVLDMTWGMPLGVGFNSGEHWAEQRRFGIRALRDFGFGKSSMEDIINEEVCEIVQGFKKEVGQSIDIRHRFNIASLNSLLHIITGIRYSNDDPKLSKILFTCFDVLENNAAQGAFYFMPWLTKHFPTLSGYKKSIAKIEPMMAFIKGEIEKHKKTYKHGEPRDFIDVYLKQIQDTPDPTSSFNESIGEKSLAVTFLDFMIAGGDTTGTALSWGILHAVQNPEVQTKVQNEIDAIVGSSRPPSLADRPRMTFMEAFISETLRLSSIIPLGIFHSASDIGAVYGFTIPKDTIIIANLWQIHHDPRYWQNPSIFRPDRYFNLKGEYIKPENVIPFSIGKRVCLGESLARDQLFLFFATMFQQFTFEIDPTDPPPKKMEANHGIVLKPTPFKVVPKLRESVAGAEPPVITIENERINSHRG